MAAVRYRFNYMISSSIFSGSIALLLAALLGFLAAWIWRSKRMAFLESQGARLRRDRRALSQRLDQANSRLDSANFKRGESDRALAELKMAHEDLETAHVALAAGYSNLRQGIVGLADDDDWFEGLDRQSEAAAQDSVDSAREAALRELQAFEEQLTSTSQALAKDPASGEPDRDTLPNDDSNDHMRTLADSQPISTIADTSEDSSVMRNQLADQQAEIARLKEQMAPLLGLPLAVSAREAERDRLAGRLQAREQELAGLNEAVERLAEREQQLTRELEKLRDGAESQPDAVPPKKKKKKKKSSTGGIDLAGRSELRVAPDGAMDVVADDFSWPVGDPDSDIADSGSEPTESSAGDQFRGPAPINSDAVGTQHPVATPPAPRQYRRAPSQIDNLKEIKGIGPVLERSLNRLGVYQFRQIADWSEEDIKYFDVHLADFRGRIRRDEWVEGARLAHRRKYDS